MLSFPVAFLVYDLKYLSPWLFRFDFSRCLAPTLNLYGVEVKLQLGRVSEASLADTDPLLALTTLSDDLLNWQLVVILHGLDVDGLESFSLEIRRI